jgi:hypothetical protein
LDSVHGVEVFELILRHKPMLCFQVMKNILLEGFNAVQQTYAPHLSRRSARSGLLGSSLQMSLLADGISFRAFRHKNLLFIATSHFIAG